MATAATATAAKAPDAKALQQKLGPLTVRRSVLARRLQEIFHLISPHRLVKGADVGTRADRLRAHAEEPQVRAELALLDAEIEEIEYALHQAQDAERQVRREEFRQKKIPLVKQLDQALQAAAEINAKLVALEAEETSQVGTASAVAWPELMPETAVTTSRLEVWREFVARELQLCARRGRRPRTARVMPCGLAPR